MLNIMMAPFLHVIMHFVNARRNEAVSDDNCRSVSMISDLDYCRLQPWLR